jgi:hypothetical protein
VSLVDELTVTNGVRPMGAPVSARHGDDFEFRWTERATTITLSRLRDNSEGPHAEILIEVDGHEVSWGKLSLVSTPSRDALVKRLVATEVDIPWRAMLERVCRETTRAFRAGSPAVLLRPRLAAGPQQLVEPVLPFGDTAVAFADGGSAKGWFALTLALVAKNGTSIAGVRFAGTQPTSTLYLDWESTQADIEDRLERLRRGLGCSADGLHYRRMSSALSADAAGLRAEVSRLGVGLVVVDSLAPACGPEPDGADAVIRTMNDLRSFGPNVSRLVIAHLSKSAAEARGTTAKPYGSVFTWNLARSVWEIRKSDDESGDELVVGLYHRKANRGRLHPPIGLRFTFTDDAVTVRSADVAQSSSLLAGASLGQRIRAILRPHALTTAEVAEALDISEDTARKTLTRSEGKGVVRLPDTRPVKWGLSA